MAEKEEVSKKGAEKTPVQPDKGGSLFDAWERKRVADKKALMHTTGRAPKGYSLFGLITIGLASLMILSVFYLTPLFVDLGDRVQYRQDLFALDCIDRARDIIAKTTTNIRELDVAFRYLQLALQNAMKVETRNEAALAMGEHLVFRARSQPIPYALMARQYLVALLDVETRSDIRLRACKALVASAYFLKDIETMAAAGVEADELSVMPDERARILLLRMDLCLEKGGWHDFQNLLSKADEFAAIPRWKDDFALREAMGKEQVLLRDKWFEAWLASYIEQNSIESLPPDPSELRARLFDEAIVRFEALLGSGVALLQAEAFFRMGRLNFHEARYEEARKRFGEFLLLEPVAYQSETLLMMTKAARKLGRMREAEELISTLMAQFPWETATEEEFLEVINKGIESGRLERVLELIEHYSRLPAAAGIMSELMCKAGHLAAAMSLYDRAKEYYQRVIDINDRDDLVITAMLALVDICFETDDVAGARVWLLDYLNRFPFEVRQGDALFALLDIDMQRGADIADILNIAVTVVNECPEDPRTAGALMLVARMLEEMGFYDLAAEQYNKVALLQYVHRSNGDADDSKTLDAMIGNARCLIKSGDKHKAGTLLRKLCSDLEAGPYRAEALYLWAMLALDDNQKNEARRRLDLIDEAAAFPEIAVRLQIQRALLDMDETEDLQPLTDRIVIALSGLDAGDNAELIRSSAVRCFEKLAERRDIQAMQHFLYQVINQGLAEILPVSLFNLRFGRLVLDERSPDVFLEVMEKNRLLMESAGIKTAPLMIDLINRAKDIREHAATLSSL